MHDYFIDVESIEGLEITDDESRCISPTRKDENVI